MGMVPAQSRHMAAEPPAVEADRALEVLVLFTGLDSTLSALRTATQLAEGLSAHIRLLLIETVPYPVPLDRPPRSLPFLDREFQSLVNRCPRDAAGGSVETSAEIVLCRDAWEGLRTRLRRNAVIVIGKRGGWWLRAENYLARKLRYAGYHVVRTSAVFAPIPESLSQRGFTHA